MRHRSRAASPWIRPRQLDFNSRVSAGAAATAATSGRRSWEEGTHFSSVLISSLVPGDTPKVPCPRGPLCTHARTHKHASRGTLGKNAKWFFFSLCILDTTRPSQGLLERIIRVRLIFSVAFFFEHGSGSSERVRVFFTLRFFIDEPASYLGEKQFWRTSGEARDYRIIL